MNFILKKSIIKKQKGKSDAESKGNIMYDQARQEDVFNADW